VTSSVLLVRIHQEKAQTEIERQAAIDAGDLARRNEAAARAAEAKAQENARVAAEQGRLAVDSLYTVVTQIQRQLRGLPGTQKLRQDILTYATARLAKVIRSADTDLTARTRAAAYQHMGDIARDLGQVTTALTHYKDCQAVIEGLTEDDDAKQVNMYNRAVVYEKLGDIYHQVLADGALARDYYRKSLSLRKELDAIPVADLDKEFKQVEAKPGQPVTDEEVQKQLESRIRTPVVLITVKLSTLSLMLGDPATAWAYYSAAITRQNKRSFATPAAVLAAVSTPNATPIAASPLKLGELAFHLGDSAAARGWLERAERLSRDAYTNTKIKTGQAGQNWADALAALGDLELKEGNTARAKTHYTDAFDVVKKRADANREIAGLRQNLSLAHYRLGSANQRLGTTAEADKQFHDCLAIRKDLAAEDPANAYVQIDLMLALARCGQFREAADLADKLRARAPRDPAMLFFSACTYALCGGPERPDKTRLALDTLERAVANGYRDPVGLNTDPDLDSARGDPRFKAVIETIKPAGD
jgi:tetratricopeptide (TPR) repeat protein